VQGQLAEPAGAKPHAASARDAAGPCELAVEDEQLRADGDLWIIGQLLSG
jgi:hypothetical protein